MLLLDNSAWSRLLIAGALPEERTETIVEWMDEGEIGVCLPFLLEAGYSARSAADHRKMVDRLNELARIPVDREVERLALRAQRELADAGHHRLPPADVTIAACAHRAGAGVLHYDRGYDIIAKHTGLQFRSEWVAPAGSL